MEKINVEVFVPSIGKKFEFILPSVMKVGMAAKLIAQAVSEQEEGVGATDEDLMLCLREKECILDNNLTIEKSGIRDGNTILVI